MSIKDIIIESVAEIMGTDMETVFTSTRKQNVVYARMIIARLLKEKTCYSETDIADVMNKDVSSVHYYLRIFVERYNLDESFRETADACRKLVKKNTTNIIDDEL